MSRILALASTLLLLLAPAALAAPGDLDRSFDGDGLRIVNWGGPDSAHDVAVQPDGKIVVVGVGFFAPVDFGISRLNPDGSSDTGFDGDGNAFVALGGDEIAFAVAVRAGRQDRRGWADERGDERGDRAPPAQRHG